VARLQPGHRRIAELVGAQPVTVQAAELSQAMATGVVESYMSQRLHRLRHQAYEHVKYWYDTQAWLPKNAVIVNKAPSTRSTSPRRTRVLKAAADAEARGWAASKKPTPSTLDKLKANGMQILPPPPQLKADMKKVGETMLKEWLDKAGPEGKAAGRRLPQVSARRCAAPLDALYDGAAWLAALCMVGLLAMVLLSIVSRQLHFHVPGTDAYAGYLMAGAGFLALAHTLKRGEHIRVTLLLMQALKGRARGARSRSGRWPRPRCWRRCSPSTACRLAWQSHQFHDISTGNDATPLWIPQLAHGRGHACSCRIALVDELVLELRGRRANHRAPLTTNERVRE
jgi:hypothetical protein